MRIACPGSRAAEAGIPDVPNPDSQRGHDLHDMIAKVLRTEATCIDIANDPVFMCFEETRAMGAIDEVRHGAGNGVLLELIEHKVDLSSMGIIIPGTVDYALVIPGHKAWLRDWKFGAHPTRWPKNNPQLMAYAVGLWRMFGVQSVEAGICQPALAEQSEPVTWDADELAAIELRLKTAVALTFKDDAQLNPGPHCRYCKARTTCRAHDESAANLAVLRDPIAVMQATDPADRARLWERLAEAITTLAGARDLIENECVMGQLQIPGYHVEQGKKNRAWTDETTARMAMFRLANAKGISQDDVEPRELISPAQADKLFGKSKLTTNELACLVKRDPGEHKLVKVDI